MSTDNAMNKKYVIKNVITGTFIMENGRDKKTFPFRLSAENYIYFRKLNPDIYVGVERRR